MTFRIGRVATTVALAGALTLTATAVAVRRVEHRPDAGAARGSRFVHRVVTSPLGTVALGATIGDHGDGRTRVWRVDGEEWHELAPSPPRATLSALAADRSTVVAVGDGDDADTWWLDARRGRWVPAGAPGAPAVPEGWSADIIDVVAGPDGFVAVGRAIGQSTSRALVGRSGDGRRWQWTTLPSEGEHAVATAVASGPTGLVAVGSEQSGRATRPAAWRSETGRSWQGAGVDAPPRTVPGGWMGVVGGAPDGFVAAGRSGYAVTLWRSVDGTRWQQVDGDLPSGDGVPLIARITARPGGGYVAVGRRTGLGDRQTPLTWTSGDGAVWRDVTPTAAGEGGYNDVVPVGASLLVAAERVDGDRVHGELRRLRL